MTSEEVSQIFQVPTVAILLYPCFRIEQVHVSGGRSSSEAWITNLSDERTARVLAEKATGTLVRKNRIQCEAMLKPVYDEELCERFEKDQYPFTMDTCRYKHFSCFEPDTCENEECWFGHTIKRTTVSVNRLQNRKNKIYFTPFS